jgi:hypothetical protein
MVFKLLRRNECNQYRAQDDSLAEQSKADNPLLKHYNGKINIITAIYHSWAVNVELYIIYSTAYIIVYCVPLYVFIRISWVVRNVVSQ